MDFDTMREIMVREQLLSRGIRDHAVIRAMSRVPRHLFVPPKMRGSSYADYPLAIGRGQTISQPYIVAYMTEKLILGGAERILEIGTGSGYQTAVLSLCASEVYTVEIISSLIDGAVKIFEELDYTNIHPRTGDGYFGWPEKAPFDGIIVTAAAEKIPGPLVDQLGAGKVMILPLGKREGIQELVQVRKSGEGTDVRRLLDVRFVPLTRRLR